MFAYPQAAVCVYMRSASRELWTIMVVDWWWQWKGWRWRGDMLETRMIRVSSPIVVVVVVWGGRCCGYGVGRDEQKFNSKFVETPTPHDRGFLSHHHRWWRDDTPTASSSCQRQMGAGLEAHTRLEPMVFFFSNVSSTNFFVYLGFRRRTTASGRDDKQRAVTPQVCVLAVWLLCRILNSIGVQPIIFTCIAIYLMFC